MQVLAKLSIAAPALGGCWPLAPEECHKDEQTYISCVDSEGQDIRPLQVLHHVLVLLGIAHDVDDKASALEVQR